MRANAEKNRLIASAARKERNGEAERIRRKQLHALADRVLAAAMAECRPDWTNARVHPKANAMPTSGGSD
jgi:glutamate formiminotransferase